LKGAFGFIRIPDKTEAIPALEQISRFLIRSEPGMEDGAMMVAGRVERNQTIY